MRIPRLNPITKLMEVFSPAGEHVERFRDEATDVALAQDDKGTGTFDILAYSGASVSRWWGEMIIDLSGIQHESQTTLLLEHYDSKPLGVVMQHLKSDKGLRLKGHFLTDEASEDARRIRLQCREQGPGRPGLKLKSSIGVRFMEYRFLEEDEEVMVNGRKVKFTQKHDVLVVTKCHMFENSLIYCNPADLATTAEVMNHGNHGASPMSVKNESATGQVMAATLAGAPSQPAVTATAPAAASATAPAGTIVRFSDLSPEGKEQALSFARAEDRRHADELAKAFPEQSSEWREKMRLEGKSVDQAKLVAYEELAAKERERKAAEQSQANALTSLQALSGRTATGFAEAGAERRQPAPAELSVLSPSREAEARLHRSPAAVELFGHDALNVMQRAVNCEMRRIRLSATSDAEGPAISESEILEAAKALLNAVPADRMARIQRLGGGHAAIDLGVITVKGFIDSYHNAMEKEDDWGKELCHMVDSNQETEIVRWLGYAPQLQVFGAMSEEANIPNYQMMFSNVWYDVAITFDVMDFMLQKFGKIDQLMGQFGAVAARHWTKLVASELENNRVGYDGVSLFNAAHNLRGKAPAAQANDLSAALGQQFLAVPDITNITPAQMNAALFNSVPFLGNYLAANGEPLNEERDRKIMVVVPKKFEAVAEAAVYSNRLDGSPGGAGGSRDNPIKVASEKRGDKWEVVGSPRLAAGANAANAFFYMALLGNDRKPFLRAEPIGLGFHFSGPGSEMHRKQNKYGFWGRSFRSTAPGAWSSILRGKLGA